MNSEVEVEGFVKMCCGAGGPAAEERGRRDRKEIGKRRMLILCYVVQSRCNADRRVVSKES